MSRFVTVLVVVLTIAIPMAAAYLGYHYGLTHAPSTEMATTTSGIAVSPSGKKPASVLPNFMLVESPDHTEVNQESKIYVAGMYTDTAQGCMIMDQAKAKAEYARVGADVPNLYTILPEVDLIVEGVQCWFGGGGPTYYLYEDRSSETGRSVVKYEVGECGNLVDCSPYAEAEKLPRL